MDIRRFYVKNSDINHPFALIRGEEYIHVTKVMRYKVGYKLIICDGDGYDYFSEIVEITKDIVKCEIKDKIFNDKELNTKIDLYIGCIKSEKLDFAIQKAVELGVDRIIPMICEYTSEKECRLDRAKRIVLEACKQSQRAILPEILEPITFEEAIKSGRGDRILAYEKEKDNKVKDVFSRLRNTVSLYVGSEGGFSQREIEYALSNGVTTFSLGKRILRTETAVTAAISAIAIFTEE